jgi:hypothetical protein
MIKKVSCSLTWAAVPPKTILDRARRSVTASPWGAKAVSRVSQVIFESSQVA